MDILNPLWFILLTFDIRMSSHSFTYLWSCVSIIWQTCCIFLFVYNISGQYWLSLFIVGWLFGDRWFALLQPGRSVWCSSPIEAPCVISLWANILPNPRWPRDRSCDRSCNFIFLTPVIQWKRCFQVPKIETLREHTGFSLKLLVWMSWNNDAGFFFIIISALFYWYNCTINLCILDSYLKLYTFKQPCLSLLIKKDATNLKLYSTFLDAATSFHKQLESFQTDQSFEHVSLQLYKKYLRWELKVAHVLHGLPVWSATLEGAISMTVSFCMRLVQNECMWKLLCNGSNWTLLVPRIRMYTYLKKSPLFTQ